MAPRGSGLSESSSVASPTAAPARMAVAAVAVDAGDRQPGLDSLEVLDELLGGLVAVGSGSLARARRTIWSSSGGISGRRLDGGFGSSFTCFMAISIAESPVNGTLPVSIS